MPTQPGWVTPLPVIMRLVKILRASKIPQTAIMHFIRTRPAETTRLTEPKHFNIDGYSNTANGFEALYNNRNGIGNTAMGDNALYSNYEGSENTGVGYKALSGNSSGILNTAIGAYAGPDESFDNTTALGYSADITASNQVRIGNDQVTSIGGYTSWSNISDGRVKKNMKENVPGLAFINKLKPITYNLDLDAADKIKQRLAKINVDSANAVVASRQLTARKEKEQIVYTGFVAQDVEKAAKELNYDFSGVDAAKNDKDLYGLRYAEFVVPLVKAVQELSNKNNELATVNDELKKKDEQQQKQIDELKTMMETLQKSFSQCNACSEAPGNSQQSNNITLQSSKIIAISNASLEQNIPNPFQNTTTINYTLPQQYSSAKILITDKSGKVLKEINLSGNGKGNIRVDATTLSSGAYQYNLYIDSKMIASKQMILAK